MKLVIWSEKFKDQLISGFFYKLATVQVEIFDNKCQFLITSETTIDPIPHLEGVHEDILQQRELNNNKIPVSVSKQTDGLQNPVFIQLKQMTTYSNAKNR